VKTNPFISVRRRRRRFLSLPMPLLAALAIIAVGCGAAGAATGLDAIDSVMNKDSTKAKVFSLTKCLPDCSPDFANYNFANKTFANPATIVWCTFTWGNPSSPLVTVPIARKLTSSSVSFYPSSRAKTGGGGGDSGWTDEWTPERRSIDGMYHGSPPPYRYGQTPGGQYVDFFNLPTFCTTAMSKFQRQKTDVSLSLQADPTAAAATAKAEAALKHGDKAGAQQALNDALGK
jgi:hypothetical protein